MHAPDDVTSRAEDLSEAEGGETGALYPGDTGTLPLEARRALVQLLSGPSLDGRRHGRLWPALIQHRAAIESRLADLFLELVVDTDLQTAFVRQADTGELDTPILLRRKPLTFLESVLLLYLRGLLADAELRGERAVVERDEMMAHLALYEPHLNTDHAGYEKRCRAAIEKVKGKNLLTAIRGSEGRFEIAPTLKLLFSAEQVAQLARSYQVLLGDEEREEAK